MNRALSWREPWTAALCTVLTRWRYSRPLALLFTIVALFDVALYAGVVYFIVDTVFQRTGLERFQLILIGFIAIAWSMRCMIDARNYPEIKARMNEVAERPVLSALAAVMAPATLIFLVSLIAAIGLQLLIWGTAKSYGAIYWVLPIILFHGIWNVVLVLILGNMMARGWLSSVVPVVFLVGVAWLLSPVMYQLGDIPQPANLILTTLNPLTHLLAAYQNAIWYAQPISLEVLPAGILVGFGLAWLLAAKGSGHRTARKPDAADTLAGPVLSIELAGPSHGDIADPPSPQRGVFRPWKGRLRGVTGQDIATLILSVRYCRVARPRTELVPVRRKSGLDRLFTQPLTLYPDWALAQLAFACAVAAAKTGDCIDGVLDHCRTEFIAPAWRELETKAAEGQAVNVRSRRLLPLPADADGYFRIAYGGDKELSGSMPDGLARAYADVRQATDQL